MKQDEIIAELRIAASGGKSPIEIAEVLEAATGGGLTQFSLASYFKQAFPKIPLRNLIDAGGWHRLSDGGVTDEQFNEMLARWVR